MSKSLPPRPSLEHLRKQARQLQSSHQAGDIAVCERLRAVLSRFASATDSEIFVGRFSLRDAQHVVAREYGCSNWPALVRAVDEPAERRTCSFCSLTIDQVQQIVTGPGDVHICDQCVKAVRRVVDGDADRVWRAGPGVCRFCSKGEPEGLTVYTRPGSEARICDSCVSLSSAVLVEDEAQRRFGPSEDGMNSLTFLASKGALEEVRAILSLGADPNGRDSRGRSALSTAREAGHADVVEALLAAGALEEGDAGQQTVPVPRGI